MSRFALAHLSASPARWILVNLEDLWLEHRAQDVPGISRECPDWRLQTRLALELFQGDSIVREQLHFVEALRHRYRRRIL